MKEVTINLEGFTLFQAPNMTEVQMMSYIITSPSGKVLVIDGGNIGDAAFLREELLARGGVVDFWLITHCHDDHYSALLEIAEKYTDIEIKGIYYNFPPQEWIDKVEPGEKEKNDRIFTFLETHSDLCRVIQEGDSLYFDGAEIEVLNDPLDFQLFTEPSPNNGSSVNDTSLVYRVTFPNGKIALFLGDLGLRAGDLLAERYGEKLKSDIVQMAHHGQNGAGENVYALIRPQVCLWTAPLWLYNNDRGNGFNTHWYKTVIVREWMDKLNVRYHLVEGEGPALIR